MHPAPNQNNVPNEDDNQMLTSIYENVSSEFDEINELIASQISSRADLVETIGKYITEAGGKRLRPLLVLLTSKALNYEGEKHVKLATIIEFLHTATLLHDDVVDNSSLRRGKITANSKWSNAASVLVGDFLYSRAFELMVDVGSLPIMAILSKATNIIAEGEVLQLSNLGNLDLSEKKYREIIRCKTALLFEAATHSAAVLSKPDETEKEVLDDLRKFGLHFGVAYQLIDDWLDYAGDSGTMGKNTGDDLAEGKMTLPLILALQNATEREQACLSNAIRNRSASEATRVIEIVNDSGALELTRKSAMEEIQQARDTLRHIEPSIYKSHLETLTEYSLKRLR